MKALTLKQPWATLVAIGAKRIETRSWQTSYRGRLAIHAAKGFPKWARLFTTGPVCYEAVKSLYPWREAFGRVNSAGEAYPLGVVLATCRLVDVVPTEVVACRHNVFSVSLTPISAQEEAFGDYSPGHFAWILEDIKPLLEPIPAKGALSLWEWDESRSTDCKIDNREAVVAQHPKTVN